MTKQEINDFLNMMAEDSPLSEDVDFDGNVKEQLKEIIEEVLEDEGFDASNADEVLKSLTWKHFFGLPTIEKDQIKKGEFVDVIDEDVLNNWSFNSVDDVNDWSEFEMAEESIHRYCEILEVYDDILIESSDDERSFDKAYYNEDEKVIVAYHFQ